MMPTLPKNGEELIVWCIETAHMPLPPSDIYGYYAVDEAADWIESCTLEVAARIRFEVSGNPRGNGIMSIYLNSVCVCRIHRHNQLRYYNIVGRIYRQMNRIHETLSE